MNKFIWIEYLKDVIDPGSLGGGVHRNVGPFRPPLYGVP